MKDRKYRKGNPRLKQGQIYVRKNDPTFVIQLIRSKYSRWECSVIAGKPPSGSQYASNYNNLGDGQRITRDIPNYEDSKGRKMVVYSSASILQSFKHDPIATKLYG